MKSDLLDEAEVEHATAKDLIAQVDAPAGGRGGVDTARLFMNVAGLLKSSAPLIRDTVVSWIDDYAPSMGAALAYYTMFSIAPLLLIVIAVASLVFGEQAARGAIVDQLRILMGSQPHAPWPACSNSVSALSPSRQRLR